MASLRLLAPNTSLPFSRQINWPSLTLTPSISTLRVAVVISPVSTSFMAAVISVTTSSIFPVSIKRIMAAIPCGTDVVGMTVTCFTVSWVDDWAERMMFLLFGRMITWSVGKFSNAFRISWVDGFMVCPPSTIAETPRLANTRAMPGPGATAIVAICPGSTGENWIKLPRSCSICSIWACRFSIAALVTIPRDFVYWMGSYSLPEGTWICMR